TAQISQGPMGWGRESQDHGHGRRAPPPTTPRPCADGHRPRRTTPRRTTRRRTDPQRAAPRLATPRRATPRRATRRRTPPRPPAPPDTDRRPPPPPLPPHPPDNAPNDPAGAHSVRISKPHLIMWTNSGRAERLVTLSSRHGPTTPRNCA